MVDDRPEDKGPLGDSGRPKREPPTIDLQATEISETPKEPAEQAAATDASPQAEHAEPSPEPASPMDTEPAEKPVAKPVSPWAIAPISGAVAATLVIAVGWALGWPAVQAPQATPQPNAAIDNLTGRVAGLESKVGKPVADPAAAARIDTIEKSLAGLRGDLAATRTQAEKLAAAINDVKAAPRDGAAAPAVDLSAINARIAGIERELAQQSKGLTDIKVMEARAAEAKAADDLPLRRLVASSLLDVLVRVGDPFATALATTKSLSVNADALKPLEGFAATGVPNANALCRELLTIVPKLNPPAPETAPTTGSGIVDRLQSGAAKLVRIQRADATGDDRGSVVARVTAAALRNDLAEARRELNTLSPADRAPAQAWLDKTDARDAALAASRKLASDAMAALAQARQ
jgi:hypothetical protein